MHVTRQGKAYQLIGTLPALQQSAPNFSLLSNTGEMVSLDHLKNRVSLVSVVPNILTRVCDLQTRQFNQTASQIDGVDLVTIAINTPEEFNDWCAAANLEMLMLSDTTRTFGKDYGLLMDELNVLARSVFVLDKDNQLVYLEVVPEMVDEPNYAAAIAVAKQYV